MSYRLRAKLLVTKKKQGQLLQYASEAFQENLF